MLTLKNKEITDEEVGKIIRSRIKLDKPWDEHSREEKIMKCCEAGIARLVICKVYHVSPNTITELKGGSGNKDDNTAEIALMLVDGVDPTQVGIRVGDLKKVRATIKDLTELQVQYANSDYMQSLTLLDMSGYLEKSNLPLRTGILKLNETIEELDEEKQSIRQRYEMEISDLKNTVSQLYATILKLRIQNVNLEKDKSGLRNICWRYMDRINELIKSNEIIELLIDRYGIANLRVKLQDFVDFDYWQEEARIAMRKAFARRVELSELKPMIELWGAIEKKFEGLTPEEVVRMDNMLHQLYKDKIERRPLGLFLKAFIKFFGG